MNPLSKLSWPEVAVLTVIVGAATLSNILGGFGNEAYDLLLGSALGYIGKGAVGERA
jgi:hypothetical protein